MRTHEMDFYKVLRSRIGEWLKSGTNSRYKWGTILALAPDFFYLVFKLSTDPDVPAKEKVKLVGVLAYFISPIDLIPEAVFGPVGFIDDVALAAFVLNALLNLVNPDVVRKHWAGEGDILELIKRIIKVADNMVGSGVLRKLKRLF